VKLSVVGMIWHDGVVLAVSRRGRPDDLCLPGGKVQSDETMEFALQREMEEETGVLVSSFQGIYAAPSSDPGFHVRVYHVLEYSGVAREVEESITPQWVPFARLCEPRNTLHRFYVEFDRWLGNRILQNSHGR